MPQLCEWQKGRMTELRRRVSLGNDLQQQHCELFYQSADVGGHVAGRRLHGKTRAKNCNEPIKKKLNLLCPSLLRPPARPSGTNSSGLGVMPRMARSMIAIMLCSCVFVTALALTPRRHAADDGLTDRLERLEAPRHAATGAGRLARLRSLVDSGHGQLSDWFKDLVPLLDCGGDLACSTLALQAVTLKSDLWSVPGMHAIAALVRGNATFAAAVDPSAASSPAAFRSAVEALPEAPTIAVIPGAAPPRREVATPWITLTPRAAELQGLRTRLSEALVALEARGTLALALEVDVDDAWFTGGEASQVAAIYDVGKGRIVIQPRIAERLHAAATADVDVLSPMYSSLAAALATKNTVGSAPGDSGVLSHRETMLMEILHGFLGDLVGESGVQMPWKCFVCVVALSMLVPLAVNLALQALVSVFCSAAHVSPDDCMAYRYDVIALGVLLTPAEVYPIADICVIQHGCK